MVTISRWKSIIFLSFCLNSNYFSTVAVDDTLETYFEREEPIQEFVLCRSCGHIAGDSHYLFNKLSPLSHYSFNETIYGRERVLVQLLTNALSFKFQLITTTKADCEGVGQWQLEDTWFPGHMWRPCMCPACGAHLGWQFKPVKAYHPPINAPVSFFGLVLAQVVGENFADSIIKFPKYNSISSDL